MQDTKPRILIISSANPDKGPGVLASDYYDAFKTQGYEVDGLTLNKCNSRPDFLYVKSPEKKICRILIKIKSYYKKVFRKVWSIYHNCLAVPHKGYYFFYFEEEKPPVPINMVLSKVKKKYDIILIIFWQGMLSFATVRELYRRQQSFIVFRCVDYSPMSGGCHFFDKCSRYQEGCGCCPAFDSKDPHDFTWRNINYRRKVYNEINPLITGNTYMHSFFKKSVLLSSQKLIKTAPIINTDLFKRIDKDLLYEHYGISRHKTFKILFGCQNITDKRKGIRYLIEALNIFYNSLTSNERSCVLIMAIGKNFGAVTSQLCGFDTFDFGFVSQVELAKIYTFSDVFLCPSVNDAGPMMVNQSLCCGTPVVGFEMGACLDAVKNQGTGYCATLCDSSDFAECIMKIFRQTPEERLAMSDRCVQFAQERYSYKAAVNNVIEAYRLYKS